VIRTERRVHPNRKHPGRFNGHLENPTLIEFGNFLKRWVSRQVQRRRRPLFAVPTFRLDRWPRSNRHL
jgi:hypothetical protein